MISTRRLASVRLRLPGSLLILSGLFIAAMVLFPAIPAHAQQLTGTLSATVYDTTGAVVPGATVKLTNEASGDVRTTTTNGEGYFTFRRFSPPPTRLPSARRDSRAGSCTASSCTWAIRARCLASR